MKAVEARMAGTIDVTAFRRDGFFLAKGLFRPAEVEAVRRDAKNVFRAQLERHGLLTPDAASEADFEAALYRYFGDHLSEFTHAGKQTQHLISLHRLSLDSRLTKVLGVLGLASPVISTRPVLYFNSRYLAKEEVYWRVFPHQDWRSMQGSLDSTVAWLPLSDVKAAISAGCSRAKW
jgi:phytanoyl-CoA hydroxylase